MPVLQRNDLLVVLGNTSKVYGEEFLADYFPSRQQTPAAWNPVSVRSRQSQPSLNYTASSAVDLVTDAISIRWVQNDNSFTKFDLLHDEENQIQDLIFLIRMTLEIPYREILANRLSTLYSYAKEEDDTSVGIDSSSLLNFYNFLRLNANLKRPSITLTPDYTIYASWETEHRQVFDVLFLPGENKEVRFVIFKPNDRHPEKEFRLSGKVTTDILIETVAPHGVLDWICK